MGNGQSKPFQYGFHVLSVSPRAPSHTTHHLPDPQTTNPKQQTTNIDKRSLLDAPVQEPDSRCMLITLSLPTMSPWFAPFPLFLLGRALLTPSNTQNDPKDLSTILVQNENKPIKLTIFNSKTEVVRGSSTPPFLSPSSVSSSWL